MKHLRYAAAATAVAALATTGAATVPAHASGGDSTRVIKTGSCDGARWKIKAQEDDGRIEVEAEIDSNRSGERWSWRLRHDGTVAARGTSRTSGRSGSFEVERQTVDRPSTDVFRFRASHAGQTCVAKIRY